MARRSKLKPGTWIERELFESKAFLSLRGFAPQLLILILGKRIFKVQGRAGKQKHVCVNADSISFTYIEAQKKYGIDKKRVTRAIDQLLEKGFLKIEHQGGAYKKDKSIYALSDNFLLWRPGSIFEIRNKEKVKRGYCEPKKHF